MENKSQSCQVATIQSYTHFNSVKTSYIWTVHDFSLCSKAGLKTTNFTREQNSNRNAKSGLESPNFTSKGNDKWCLYLTPKETKCVDFHIGDSIFESYPKFAIIRLFLKSSDQSSVHATCQFSILDTNGVVKKVEEPFEMITFQPTKNIAQMGQQEWYEWNVRCEIPVKHLSRYLDNNTLTIKCDVTVKGAKAEFTDEYDNKEKHHATLSNDFDDLFKSSLFTDFVVVAGEREFNVHKAILAARSSVFKAMLENDMKKRNKGKLVSDLDSSVMATLLEFIYTGNVSDVASMAEELLAAADKYDVKELKKMCEESLCPTLSTANALHLYQLAELHEAEQLRTHAVDFINSHAGEVKKREAWNDTVKANPQPVVKMDGSPPGTSLGTSQI